MSSTTSPKYFEVHSAEQRPDIWKFLNDENHPLNQAWPRFMDHDLSEKHLASKLIKYAGLRRFQFAVVEKDSNGSETVVASARCIPFFWPELDPLGNGGTDEVSQHPEILNSLPDGGWGTITSRGIRQYCSREWISKRPPAFTRDQERDSMTSAIGRPPNALSALNITIRGDRHGVDLAEKLIEQIRKTAIEENLQVVVAPVRPTRKSEVPFVRMEEYARWTQNLDDLGEITKIHVNQNGYDFGCQQIYDPLLRKHIQLGGKIAKIAQSSRVVRGTLEDWKQWIDVDFHEILQKTLAHEIKVDLDDQKYIEHPIPGGLVPVKIYVKEKIGMYCEPNIWVYHKNLNLEPLKL